MFSRKAVFIIRYVMLAALCISLFSAGNIHAQEATSQSVPPVQDEVKKGENSSEHSPSGYGVLFLPSGHLYQEYAADPNRVDFGFQVLHYQKTSIPEAGSNRFDLKTGGEFGLVRIQPKGSEDRGAELALQGGIHAQFDIDNALDNIGWDGWYSLMVSTAVSRHLSMRFGWLHDSSHIGDEYIKRTGRQRIGYTRQEFMGGISWLTDSGLRTYAEYGWAKMLGNTDLQKPGRLQTGFEWLPAKFSGGLYRGWYGAADFSAMQERDWKVDVSLQTGYRIDSGGKTWRFGVDWYSGRPPIGEFFQLNEQYLGFGIWVDI